MGRMACGAKYTVWRPGQCGLWPDSCGRDRRCPKWGAWERRAMCVGFDSDHASARQAATGVPP